MEGVDLLKVIEAKVDIIQELGEVSPGTVDQVQRIGACIKANAATIEVARLKLDLQVMLKIETESIEFEKAQKLWKDQADEISYMQFVLEVGDWCLDIINAVKRFDN